MTDEELAEKVGRALYIERPLELDQEGGDDWDILPEEWREEWIDAGRVAVAAVKKARRLTRPRTQQPADPSLDERRDAAHALRDLGREIEVQDHENRSN